MASQSPAWFALIDGAQDPRLQALVRSCREYLCLYKGKLEPDLSEVAPWLVRIADGDPLMPTWQQYGRGQNWGIMMLSTQSIEALQRHFRRFTEVLLPDGDRALFRFYDPRVFNTYIRAATPQERAPWFDGVLQYATEKADGTGLHQFRLVDDRLLDGESPVG